jgi:hypothetical protein
MVVGLICSECISLTKWVYQLMLKQAAPLMPLGVSVRFLADCGFADTRLMRYLRDKLQRKA